MKTKKLNLDSIKKSLTKEEMKLIMAGSPAGAGNGDCFSQGCWFIYCVVIEGDPWAYWECPGYGACIEKGAYYCYA